MDVHEVLDSQKTASLKNKELLNAYIPMVELLWTGYNNDVKRHAKQCHTIVI